MESRFVIYLQLNHFPSIRFERLLCFEAFRSGDFKTVQRCQLRKSDDDVIAIIRIIWLEFCSQLGRLQSNSLSHLPVQGFPVRNNSCRWMLRCKLSTLVNSPMKFNVRSNFCSDSHPSRFSIFSTLFIARFRYSSFFNLLRFSGWTQRRLENEWKLHEGR